MNKIKREEMQKNVGDVGGNNQGSWLHSGRNLKEAADVLARERKAQFGSRDWFVAFAKNHEKFRKGIIGLEDSYFFMPPTLMPEYMLYGYAMENFLYALCVKRKVVLYRKGMMVEGGNHDLITLTKLAGVSVDKSERSTLGGLRSIMMVSGRYPIEKNMRKPKPPITWQELSEKKVKDLFTKITLELSKGESDVSWEMFLPSN